MDAMHRPLTNFISLQSSASSVKVISTYRPLLTSHKTTFISSRGHLDFARKEALGTRSYRAKSTMARTYEDAVEIIDSRRRGGRPKSTASSAESLKATPANGTPDLRGTPSLVGMKEWLAMLGHLDDDISALNVIHIAGTKGKGSTCAFTECILRSHGQHAGYPKKTGLYSSPHLINPEERIRIDSQPLDRDLFAKYLFEVYDRLPQLAVKYDPSKSVVDKGPRYLQLYALLAFHVFIREEVDVAIFETHNGGEYDATNVVSKPIVTAITTLGMDHIEMLGPTIENIAWHKSGIYKPGAVALSTVQEDAPAGVLVERAKAQGEEVEFVGEDPQLPRAAIQLKPSVQKKNSSLAIAVAKAFLARTAPPDALELTVKDIEEGIAQFSWPARFQIVVDGDHTWFLDAAHNDISVAIAAQWFSAAGSAMAGSKPVRTLIFSHINEFRDPAALLKSLAKALKDSDAGVEHVVFTTYDESEKLKARSQSKSQELFHKTWAEVLPETTIWDEPTIQDAVQLAKRIGSGDDDEGIIRQTLITGSQHLVGPALRVLQTNGADIS